jgi:hypothetical protein
MMHNRVVIRAADGAEFFAAAKEAARRADRGEPFDGTITLGVDPAVLDAYRKPSTVRGYVKVVEQTKPDAANDGGAKTARRAFPSERMRAPHRRASAENLGRSPFPLARSASPPPVRRTLGGYSNLRLLACFASAPPTGCNASTGDCDNAPGSPASSPTPIPTCGN